MNFVGRFLCHVVFSFEWFLKSRPFACEPLDLLFRFPPPLLLVCVCVCVCLCFFFLFSLFFSLFFLLFVPENTFSVDARVVSPPGMLAVFQFLSRVFFSFLFLSFLPCCYTYRST